MILNEAPLLVIQQILGHADPKTTLRYIRRAEELAARAYRYNTLPSWVLPHRAAGVLLPLLAVGAVPLIMYCDRAGDKLPHDLE